MNSISLTRSNTQGEIGWHEINWQQVHQNVRRIQIRIVKAVKEGNKRKIRGLQRMLTRSFSAAALAVKRVTESRGKSTPGIDNIIWDTPLKKSQAINKIRKKTIKAIPLKRIYIPKSNKIDKRPLSIPAFITRAEQAKHLLALEPIAETLADRYSFGFRPERSTADAIGLCFTILSQKDAAQYILEGDIKSCFDTISFEWLLSHIPMDRKVLYRWLHAGYIEENKRCDTKLGVPQGGLCKA